MHLSYEGMLGGGVYMSSASQRASEAVALISSPQDRVFAGKPAVNARTPRPARPRSPTPPPSASVAGVTPASNAGSLGPMVAYSWQLRSARVHGGSPRPSFTAKREDRNICERSRESSAGAGEQFPFSAGGSIRELDFGKTDHTARRKEATTSSKTGGGASRTVRALMCKSKVQLHFLLRQLTFPHLTPAHLVNS